RKNIIVVHERDEWGADLWHGKKARRYETLGALLTEEPDSRIGSIALLHPLKRTIRAVAVNDQHLDAHGGLMRLQTGFNRTSHPLAAIAGRQDEGKRQRRSGRNRRWISGRGHQPTSPVPGSRPRARWPQNPGRSPSHGECRRTLRSRLPA